MRTKCADDLRCGSMRRGLKCIFQLLWREHVWPHAAMAALILASSCLVYSRQMILGRFTPFFGGSFISSGRKFFPPHEVVAVAANHGAIRFYVRAATDFGEAETEFLSVKVAKNVRIADIPKEKPLQLVISDEGEGGCVDFVSYAIGWTFVRLIDSDWIMPQGRFGNLQCPR